MVSDLKTVWRQNREGSWTGKEVTGLVLLSQKTQDPAGGAQTDQRPSLKPAGWESPICAHWVQVCVGGLTLRPWVQVCVGGLLLTLGPPWDPQALGTWGQRDREQVKGLLYGLTSLDKDTSNERQLVLGSLTAPGRNPAAAE